MYELDPWGELREDWRQANIGAAICRTWGAKIDADDLVIRFDRDKEAEQKAGAAAFLAWAEAHNAAYLNKQVAEAERYFAERDKENNGEQHR